MPHITYIRRRIIYKYVLYNGNTYVLQQITPYRRTAYECVTHEAKNEQFQSPQITFFGTPQNDAALQGVR